MAKRASIRPSYIHSITHTSLDSHKSVQESSLLTADTEPTGEAASVGTNATCDSVLELVNHIEVVTSSEASSESRKLDMLVDSDFITSSAPKLKKRRSEI